MENDPNVLKVVAHETIETGELPPGTPSHANTPLQVQADETINTKDVPPGTSYAQALREHEESLPKEEVEKRQKIMLEYTRLSSRYCEPHNNKSRWVKAEDLAKVVADGQDLVAMCNLPRGKYSGIAALAHPQIDAVDPLRYFVFPNGMVIINPVITSHTKTPVMKAEGCMSHEDKDVKKDVPRFNKITVTYQTLTKRDKDDSPALSDPVTETLNGGQAHVFQHEVDHLNGQDIYMENFNPENVSWFGIGAKEVSEEELMKMYV